MKEKLKELRKELGVTQAVVAKAIGVSVSAYSNYEQGTREPALDIILKLCKYYKVSIDYLVSFE